MSYPRRIRNKMVYKNVEHSLCCVTNLRFPLQIETPEEFRLRSHGFLDSPERESSGSKGLACKEYYSDSYSSDGVHRAAMKYQQLVCGREGSKNLDPNLEHNHMWFGHDDEMRISNAILKMMTSDLKESYLTYQSLPLETKQL